MGYEKITLSNRRGQNFIEYVMLIMIIGAAVIAMTMYLYRSVNARLSQSHQELNYYKAER